MGTRALTGPPTMSIARRALRAAKVAKVALAVPGYSLARDKGRYAGQLRERIEDAGCLAVKIGQWVSSRTDIFPPALTAEFSKLRTDVAPMEGSNVRDIVAAEMGSEYFASFDPQPMSTGSIAQVHRATTAAGEDVAVKVRRPGLAHELEDDIHIITWLMKPFQWINPKMYEDLVASLSDLVETVRLELDFTLEAEHMRRFRAFFDQSEVRVPGVVAATPQVIVMEYVKSVGRPTDAALLIKTFFLMLFELGSLHTDLHAGNLGRDEDGRLILYDFGSVLECPASLQMCLKHLMVAYLNRNTSVMLDYMLEYGMFTGSPPNGVLPPDERRMLEEFLESVLMYVEQTDIEEFARIVKTIALPEEATLSFRPDVVMVFRSFSLMEGLCKELDPNFVIIDAVAPMTEYFVSDAAVYRLKMEDDLRTIWKLFS